MIRVASQSSTSSLCRGAFGVQSDAQCLGYDHLCALAMLEEGDSYERVYKVRQKIASEPYYSGFTKGWDGRTNEDEIKPDEVQGYKDGVEAARSFPWRISRLYTDCSSR